MRAAATSGRGATISAARRELAMTVPELWLAYVAVGGNATLTVVGAWIEGNGDIPDRDYDYLAQGLNDQFVERGGDHPIAYSTDS